MFYQELVEKNSRSCKTGIIINGDFCYVDDMLLTSTTVTMLQKPDRHSCVTISQTDITFQKLHVVGVIV